MDELSTYSVRILLSNDDVAGATSDGFNTTALPAAIAPITGSSESTAEDPHFIMCPHENRF